MTENLADVFAVQDEITEAIVAAEEAMRLSREGIRQRSDFVGAHRVLTAAAGMAGQPEVGRGALQELRRAQPNISLDWIASKIPIQQPTEMQHYLEGFRRSGLS